MKLTQYFNCIHVAGGYPVEPVDIHAIGPPPRLPLREADADRQGGARLQPRPRAGRGRDRDGAHRQRPRRRPSSRAQPRLFTNINSSSPLKHDWPMLDGAMRFARRGQPVIVTPVHARRRHGAGDHGRRGGAVDRRGAGGDRAAAGGPARCRLHDRHLHLERRHEVRRPRLRHAGIHARHADDRADGAVLRAAAARLQRLRLERAGWRRRCGRA